MKLFIRETELSDWLPVKELLTRLHDKAPYSKVPINYPDMKRTFATTARSKNALSMVVADKKHRIYGVCICITQPNWWGATCSLELVTYCEAPGWQDKLIRRYVKWAKERNIQVITVVNSAGENPRYDNLIQKINFQKTGSVHMMLPEGE